MTSRPERPLRLFVAADPPAGAVEHLGAAVDQLQVSQSAGRSTRLAARERWHITLAFLGDVDAGRVGDASAALERAVTAARAPIVVRIAGGGRFGRGRFGVLWAGLDGDVAALATLARAVRRELRAARLPVDDKPFRPHLTIARPGDRLSAEQVAQDVAALRPYIGPQWTVAAVHLVASELGPSPRHHRLGSVPLSPG
ncbi:MAG: RNA 2',3'-cyclic phosphodiesterase [Micromonosporaceae bacterium]